MFTSTAKKGPTQCLHAPLQQYQVGSPNGVCGCRHPWPLSQTRPLHPQSDGLVELFNHNYNFLASQLAILTSRQQRDWDRHLPTDYLYSLQKWLQLVYEMTRMALSDAGYSRSGLMNPIVKDRTLPLGSMSGSTAQSRRRAFHLN